MSFSVPLNLLIYIYIFFSDSFIDKFSQFSHSVVSDSLRPHELQHARPHCSSPTPGVHSNSHPSSQWCHPAISSSVVPFSSCPQPLAHSLRRAGWFLKWGESRGDWWVQAHSAHHTKGQWIWEMRSWGKEETLFREPADREDGRLAPQNNCLIEVWMPDSL